ncbi:MAG: VWA domain-containing protein [Bdellovibrionales bacterium]|nr:VWA domain-containing protein [Bdellovibrionales bacterium]
MHRFSIGKCALFFLLAVWFPSAPAFANQVELSLKTLAPFRSLEKEQALPLEIGISLTQAEGGHPGPPRLNLCFLIDTSASMEGAPLLGTKVALRAAIAQLRPDDVVCIVSFSSMVATILPPVLVKERVRIEQAIDTLTAGGGTALFAGLAKGAEQLRRHAHEERLSHLVLLSDSHADIGPNSPAQLGRLSVSLRKSGIGISTIGVGDSFNAELMLELARTGGGRSYAAATPEGIASVIQSEVEALFRTGAIDFELTLNFGDSTFGSLVAAESAAAASSALTVAVGTLQVGKAEKVGFLLRRDQKHFEPGGVLVEAIGTFRNPRTGRLEEVKTMFHYPLSGTTEPF